MDTEELIWERISCDWCGSSEYIFIFEGPDHLEHINGLFKVVRCTHCGLYRQNPRLVWDSLKHYYPEGYISHYPLVKDQTTFWRRIDKRYGSWKRLRALERYQHGGQLLEVGCGTGLFLEEALRSGKWQPVGIEPSTHAVRYVRENLGVPVFRGLFSDVEFEAQSFDVIAMWNVLEHLQHPINDLRRAHNLLKDDGWLVFSIPNLSSWEARLFGSYWVGWDLPRHLYLFPNSTLRKILDKFGFKWVASSCISGSYSTLGLSIQFWSQKWGDRHPHLHRIINRIYHTLFMRAILIPPLWTLDRLKLSTIITIFAQKYHLHGEVG